MELERLMAEAADKMFKPNQKLSKDQGFKK